MAYSVIVKELKRDRLRVHLDGVETLISDWRGQLSAPDPFRPGESDIWPALYRPAIEHDPDNIHMLRRHLHSRALWKHHSDWGFKLECIHRLGEPLVKDAGGCVEALGKRLPDMRFTDQFVRTALSEAFDQAAGEKSVRGYAPNPEHGVRFGGSTIEKAASPEANKDVEEAHRALVTYVKTLPQWKDIVLSWRGVKKTEESMDGIVKDVLKSGDIFHPCRFCRKLFLA